MRDGSRDAIATLVALGGPALPCVGSLLQRLASQRTARAGRIRWFVAIELTREWSHQARFERAAVAAMLAASLKRARSNAQRSSWIAADAIIDLLGTHALPVLDDVLRTAGRVGRAAAVTAMLRFVFEGRLNNRLAALLQRVATTDPAPSVRSRARNVLALDARRLSPGRYASR